MVSAPNSWRLEVGRDLSGGLSIRPTLPAATLSCDQTNALGTWRNGNDDSAGLPGRSVLAGDARVLPGRATHPLAGYRGGAWGGRALGGGLRLAAQAVRAGAGTFAVP